MKLTVEEQAIYTFVIVPHAAYQVRSDWHKSQVLPWVQTSHNVLDVRKHLITVFPCKRTLGHDGIKSLKPRLNF